MQKLGLTQSLQQKLSPQQIQFIKLLQVPTAELDSRIEEELEDNPALEEGKDEAEDPVSNELEEESQTEKEDDLDIDDYLGDDDYSGFKMRSDGEIEDKEMPIPTQSSLNEQLMQQLGYLRLNEREYEIGKQLIGSIESDGYIRRDLEAIVNDLLFSQNIDTDPEEIESVLMKIQAFDPPGIGARNLKECLLIQLERNFVSHEKDAELAKMILRECYDEFTKKHYSKIIKKLEIDDEEAVKEALELIRRLNPKPGGSSAGLVRTQYLLPDFLVTNNNGKLELTLNSKNAPELKISRSYADMFDAYEKSDKRDKKLKDTVSFVKQKLDAAKWFIDAIKQRQHTLLKTMKAIIDYQYDFFMDGDESKLRPMILKDIAEMIDMDISTVSRVANSKAVQTEFGIYPLKYFFSEGIATESGEDVSSREVKSVLKKIIEEEEKTKPYSDDKLEKMLKAKGYNIARRTVAKYREQMNIPVARLRKEL